MEKYPVPQFAILTGKEKPGTYSHGYRFLPTNEEASAKGTLLVNLSLITMEKADLENLAQRLITALHESYFQDPNSTIIESLKRALSSAQSQLKTILPTIAVHSLTTDIQLGVVLNQFLYLAKTTEEPVYLKRGETLTPIRFNRVASGRLDAGDWLLMANKNFWQQVTPDRINSALSNNFDRTLKEIDQVVGDKEDISCILANFQIEESLGDQEKISLIDPSSIHYNSITRIGQDVIAAFTLGLKNLLQMFKRFIKHSLSSQFNKKRPPSGPADMPALTGKSRGRGRKRGRFFLLLIIVVFSIGLFTNLYFKNISTNRNQANKLVKEASQDFNDAQSVAVLNTPKAKELLSKATQKIAAAKKLNKSLDTAGLEKSIDNLQATLRREYRVAQLPLFYDLSFLKKGIEIGSISFDKDSLVALDSNIGGLMLLDLKEKKGSVVTEDARLKGATRLIVDSNIGYILSEGVILRFDFFKKDFLTPISLTEQAKDFQIYNGSLYILTANNLKKAVLTSDGVSSFNSYTSDKSIDFKTTKTLAVDGFVWVGTDASLFKLSRGERVEFSLSGLDKALASIRLLYSNEGTNYLYLLDKANSRIVVIDKNGSYYSQYITPQLNDIRSILADEAKNRLYVAVGEKIYLLDIRKDSSGN